MANIENLPNEVMLKVCFHLQGVKELKSLLLTSRAMLNSCKLSEGQLLRFLGRDLVSALEPSNQCVVTPLTLENGEFSICHASFKSYTPAETVVMCPNKTIDDLERVWKDGIRNDGILDSAQSAAVPLARLYQAGGRLSEAIDVLERVWKARFLFHGDCEAVILLAATYGNENRIKDAIKLLTRARRMYITIQCANR